MGDGIKKIVGTRCESVVKLPVRTVLITENGTVYIHHSPGRWRNGTTGEEVWASILDRLNPVVVYHPEEGLPRPESFLIQEAYDRAIEMIKDNVVDSSTYSYLGYQIMDILVYVQNYLKLENERNAR